MGKIIAVDFDGTCVTHEYPNVGKDIGAVPVLKWLTDNGHKIILWTMRSGRGASKVDRKGFTHFPKHWSVELKDAYLWFHHNNIPLYGINENPDQHWSKSPKAYAELYIDDAALGCPLKFDKSISDKPFVDWVEVRKKLEEIFKGESLIGHTTLIEKEKSE